MRRATILVVVGLLPLVTGGCTIDRRGEAGTGLTSEGSTVAVDESTVPVIGGTCAPGETVVRTDSGWACAPGVEGPTGPTGPIGPTGVCDTSRLDALEERLAALELHRCPAGFAFSVEETFTVCSRTFAGAGDVMVKVGDFWIDRYEASPCGNPDLGEPSGNTTLATGCSTPGATPLTNVSWFQAAALCANSGKRLCSNTQWQTAAAGTPDPGSWPDLDPANECTGPASTSQCNTCAGGPGPAGGASGCVSRFGAYDLIGNVWEWVGDWYMAGRHDMYEPAVEARPWPAAGGFGDGEDLVVNVDGQAFADGVVLQGVPAAGLRGGAFNMNVMAGAFAFYAGYTPSSRTPHAGFRCCIGGP